MFDKLKKLFSKKERNDKFLIKPECEFCKAKIEKRKYICKTECCGRFLHHECNNTYILNYNHCACCHKEFNFKFAGRSKRFWWLLLI